MADSHRTVVIKLTPVSRPSTALVDGAVRAPRPGEPVVVRFEGGTALGRAVAAIPQTIARRGGADAASSHVVRLASHEDLAARARHERRERDAHRVALTKIRSLGLSMKLTRVEQAFDGARLTFYFTADERVDFRDLVRELAAEFRVRIEMRQIGVRDEAKALGGYGTCGRPLCCTTFLTSFEPVSIKMAKQQELSLNPSKLSGMCGRLKCCLRYETTAGQGQSHPGCGSEGGGASRGGCGSGSEGGCGSRGGCGSGGGCGSCRSAGSCKGR
jgi:cell fate regulator YaaT (PSP1 superfamily)